MPLQQADKPDVGCLIGLFAIFIGVFLFPAILLLGGAPIIVPLILCLLMLVASPWVNPLERRTGPAKWWGRAITFLVMAGMLVAVWYWWLGRGGEQKPFDERQQGGGSLNPCVRWS